MSKKVKWTPEKIQEDALRHNRKSTWAKESQSAYQAARRLDKENPGFLEEVTGHMENPKRGRKLGQVAKKEVKEVVSETITQPSTQDKELDSPIS